MKGAKVPILPIRLGLGRIFKSVPMGGKKEGESSPSPHPVAFSWPCSLEKAPPPSSPMWRRMHRTRLRERGFRCSRALDLTPSMKAMKARIWRVSICPPARHSRALGDNAFRCCTKLKKVDLSKCCSSPNMSKLTLKIPPSPPPMVSSNSSIIQTL